MSSETLERGTTMVRNPTTGAILDGKFYFMANTGIANLKDSKIADPKKLDFPRFPLRSTRGRKTFGQIRTLELRISARIRQSGETPIFPLRYVGCAAHDQPRLLSCWR